MTQTQQHENQLPKQVIAARAEADEMRKALFGQGDTPAGADDGQSVDTGAQPAQQQAPNVQQPENWEAKFHTLQGKYNAEVPRLSETLRQQSAEIQRLTQLVEALQAKQPEPTQQTQQPQSSVDREALTAYDEEFGKLVDLIEAQKAQIEALTAQVGQVQGNVQQVGQAQQTTAAELFWGKLYAAVPDFDAVNADPAFHTWLAEPDGLSGLTRKQIGDRALAEADHAKVARIINEYKSQRGQQKQPPPQQNITPDTKSGNVDAQVAQIQAPGPIIRQSEMTDFYRKIQAGFPFEWRGQIVKDAAAASLIRVEIQKAGVEGRIVP